MPRVKIIWCSSRDMDDYGDWKSLVGTSDWAEVTEDELKLLKRYSHMIQRSPGEYSTRAYIIEDVPKTDVRGFLKEIEKQCTEQRKQEEKHAKEAELRKKRLASTAKDRKRKQLEKLKKELGES